MNINNGVILQGTRIYTSTKIYTFPCSYSKCIWGIGLSQSNTASANVGRIALDNVTLTEINFLIPSGAINPFAYVLVVGV